MICTPEQVLNGLINYADNEVIGKLPTSGKWVVGTALGLATTRTAEVIEALRDNMIIKMLGIMDDEGNVDIENLVSALKKSAEKYGNLSVNVPLVGRLTFNAEDIERMRGYML